MNRILQGFALALGFFLSGVAVGAEQPVSTGYQYWAYSSSCSVSNGSSVIETEDHEESCSGWSACISAVRTHAQTFGADGEGNGYTSNYYSQGGGVDAHGTYGSYAYGDTDGNDALNHYCSSFVFNFYCHNGEGVQDPNYPSQCVPNGGGQQCDAGEQLILAFTGSSGPSVACEDGCEFGNPTDNVVVCFESGGCANSAGFTSTGEACQPGTPSPVASYEQAPSSGYGTTPGGQLTYDGAAVSTPGSGGCVDQNGVTACAADAPSPPAPSGAPSGSVSYGGGSFNYWSSTGPGGDDGGGDGDGDGDGDGEEFSAPSTSWPSVSDAPTISETTSTMVAAFQATPIGAVLAATSDLPDGTLSCVPPSFEVYGEQYSFEVMCELYGAHAPLLRSFAILSWSISAAFVFLRA